MAKEAPGAEKRRRRVMLVYNPAAGKTRDADGRLLEVTGRLQAQRLIPETCLLEPGKELGPAVLEARGRGISLFIACGGDGTVSAVARAVAGLPATLGILPVGTRNNIALSLGIPAGLQEAAALLREGRRIKIDLGQLACTGARTPFLEICSVGLPSSVFPATDGIQHGHPGKIGEFLSALITGAPSEIRLRLDGGQLISFTGQAVLVSNMPYAGRNIRLGGLRAFQDGVLDVLLLGDLPKLSLLGYAVSKSGALGMTDPKILRLQARSIDLETLPAMPIMSDGVMLGEGKLSISILRRGLGVMTARPRKGGEAAL